jgi:hypothetical protein
MSGYMPAQAALKTLLLTLTADFPAGTVTEGDQRVHDLGVEKCAILFPGGVPAFDTVSMERQHEYECLLDLFLRYKDHTSYNDFGTLRDTVITLLDATKYVTTTHKITLINTDGDPAELRNKTGGGPFWIYQTLRLTISEDV